MNRPHIQNILFLTAESPFPPLGGGRMRDASLIRMLSATAPVEVLCFANPSAHGPRTPPPDVKLTEIPRDRAPIWRRAVYPLRTYLVNGYSDAMEEAIRTRAHSRTLIWVSRLAMAQYIEAARNSGARVVLDEHNVESHLLLEHATSSARKLPKLWHGLQAWHYEKRFCASADVVVATSELDAAKLRRMAPAKKVFVVPNAVDAAPFDDLLARPGESIFFSGTLTYGPNIEGLDWFVAKVLPRLRSSMGARLPRMVVAGADPGPELVQRLTAAGIEVHPNPPSMLPLLGEAAVVIAPLRSGSGTRLKILEAMAAGRAVVSTGKGAEGLVLSPTWDIWIADTADHFAGTLLNLLSDPKKRAETGSRAAATVREHYDWRQVSKKAEDVVGHLFGRKTGETS